MNNYIYEYSRAQAIEDGVLIDVSKAAQEAGFIRPVALTSAAWAECVAWSDADNEKTHQDERGRLHDVLWMAHVAIRNHSGNNAEILYYLLCVPRDGKSTRAVRTQLKIVAGPGDKGEMVITIMLPNED